MCSSPPTGPPPPPRGFHTPMGPPQAPTSCSGRYTCQCTHGSYSLPSPAQRPCPNPCTPQTYLTVLIQMYSGGEYNLYEHAARKNGGGAQFTYRPVRCCWGFFRRKKARPDLQVRSGLARRGAGGSVNTAAARCENLASCKLDLAPGGGGGALRVKDVKAHKHGVRMSLFDLAPCTTRRWM